MPAVTRADTMHRPGWRAAWGAFATAVAGLALSIYLTYEHFSGSRSFACPANSSVNCEKVTTSAWSHVAGVPVAVLGLVFFVGMALLLSPPAWRYRQLDWLRILGSVVGIGAALYLVWAEVVRIKAICLYCTGVHICCLLLLGLVLWATSEMRAGPTAVAT